MADRVRHRTETVRVVARGGVTAVGLIALWQLAVGTELIDYESVPTPLDIAKAAREVATGGELWPALSHSLGSVLISWMIAVILGVLLGALIGLVPVIDRFSSTSIEILRPLPAIGFIPVAVVILGLSQQVEIAVAAYAAVWPVLVNTSAGVSNVAPRLRQVGQVFGLSRARVALRITLPAALPAVLVGIRIALGIALVVVIAVEMVGVPNGVGYQIVTAQQAYQPAQMYFYIVLAGVLGVLLNLAVVQAAKLLFPGTAALAARS